MKHINEALALMLLSSLFGLMVGVNTAHAQNFTAAGASSNATATTSSGSQAISGGGTGGVGASNFTIVPQSTVSINSTGSDLGKSVPLVTAPQMTVLGGEDSCLKSRSGGGAFSGFGASFGTMVMDNECNRRVLSKQLMAFNQPQLAVAVLCGSPQMWAAAARVAKMRGGTSVCNNAQPSSADVVSPELAKVSVDKAEESKWSFSSREESGFIY